MFIDPILGGNIGRLHDKIETQIKRLRLPDSGAPTLCEEVTDSLTIIHRTGYLWAMNYYSKGAFRFAVLVLVLTAGAGLFTLLITDIDVFEAKTGFFSAVGTFIINAIVAITGLFGAIYAISVFFPKRWGPKSGIVGAIVGTLVAAFCLRVLLLGGV